MFSQNSNYSHASPLYISPRQFLMNPNLNVAPCPSALKEIIDHLSFIWKTIFYTSFMSDNENTLVKNHWSGKGNISVQHWKTRNWSSRENLSNNMQTSLTMTNTMVKDHWLQEYNFRVALKDQTRNKQSRKFDILSKDGKHMEQSKWHQVFLWRSICIVWFTVTGSPKVSSPAIWSLSEQDRSELCLSDHDGNEDQSSHPLK